jgi:hypothetical protein
MVAAKNTSHGKSKTAEYRLWKSMIDRCTNPKNKAFKHYGGRGIQVCQRWSESFTAFLEDMGPRPNARHDIDRYPDNNGNYEPGNCRWVLHKANCNNTRGNRILEDEGIRRTLTEWADLLGAPASVIWQRIHRLGWSVHDAVTRPVQRR